MQNLVIVESGAKAKTIQSYLNQLKGYGTFIVLASLGHVCDLPSKEMGVDTQSGTWTVTYQRLVGKKGILEKITKAAKEVCKSGGTVYLASDPDREGEAIAYHLSTALRAVRDMRTIKLKRIVFHEITQHAVVSAIQHPRDIDMHLVNAQEARRILDRVVGYELSPVLWKRFPGSALSGGRVQSAVLKMIVDRFQAYDAFECEPYWTLDATFQCGSDAALSLSTTYYSEGGDGDEDEDRYGVMKVYKTTCLEALKSHVASLCKVKSWSVDYKQSEWTKTPPPPFTTSSFQQEVYNRFHISMASAMRIAQSLYEKGYITYMRTDSTYLSDDAKTMIHEWIADTYGKSHVHSRTYKSKVANAQEAHECIRVTDVNRVSLLNDDEDAADIGDNGNAQKQKIYRLIWQRTIASQMIPATYTRLQYSFMHDNDPGQFRGHCDVLKSPGFLLVYSHTNLIDSRQQEQEQTMTMLSSLSSAWHCVDFHGIGDATRPTPLYTEATLVKSLEKEGIGRPSTYATLVDKLLKKGYCTKDSAPTKSIDTLSLRCKRPTWNWEETPHVIQIGGGSAFFIPTPTGIRVTEYLMSAMDYLLNASFTSQMETQLDDISNAKQSKETMLSEFYSKYHHDIVELQNAIAQHRPTTTTTSKEKKTPKSLHAYSPTIDLVKTRFGEALYDKSSKQFISLQPFLEWKQKSADALTSTDIAFLTALPYSQSQSYSIHMGRYGLYGKNKHGKNIKINRCHWDALYKVVAESLPLPETFIT